jgi:hypothetical protein
LRFRDKSKFYRVGLSAQPPTWRTRVSLFVWVTTFDLSGMGAPVSSYRTASIALRTLWPRKPHHYIKVGTPSVGIQHHFHSCNSDTCSGRNMKLYTQCRRPDSSCCGLDLL